MGADRDAVRQQVSAGRDPVPPLAAASLGLLACPACGGDLGCQEDTLACVPCGRRYPCAEGIPQLFWPHEAVGDESDVTEVVKAFYEANPFPDYEEYDSPASFREKAEQGVFAKLLDEQVPPDATILDVGCGTGQLSNFLALAPLRRVFGIDGCMNSLRLGTAFARRSDIDNVAFCQMNLFRPAFKPRRFDLVVCQGVLHHTSRPLEGFRRLAALTKPGGFLIVGLYNAFGRIPMRISRALIRVSGWHARWLDGRLRSGRLGEVRAHRWFMDQYRHPHESVHTFGEVLRWFRQEQVAFVSSIPQTSACTSFSADEHLFMPHPVGSRWDRALAQFQMLLRGGYEGGLFVMIGRLPLDIDRCNG